MKVIHRLHTKYGKRRVWSVIGAIAAIIIILIVLAGNGNGEDSQEGNSLPTVTVGVVRDIASGSSIDLIGSVKAVDEVRLETEASGRITTVNVTLGQQLGAGQTIAQIENASQYASLLQAEGAYDAAVASARGADVSLTSAQNDAVNAYRTSFSTVTDILLNTVDALYSNPKSTTPGIKIETGGNAGMLNRERYALNTILEEWQRTTVTLNTSSDLDSALAEARENVRRVQAIVDTFIPSLARANAGTFTEAQLATYRANFAAADASLTSLLTTIDNAQDTLSRAELSGSGGQVSAADAQVKQALGSLRAAQANYAKTVIRTPIAGTVNSLSVKEGDYVNTFAPVAIIANNDALEITTYVGESDRERITVGQTVMIEQQYTGIITQIAPAVDPVTKKVEVKIQSESSNISNGDTVTINVSADAVIDDEQTGPIIVPITAVKFSAENGQVLSVNNEGILVSHDVVLGDIIGSFIEVREGITRDEMIVIDARGLNAGQHVEPVTR